METQVEEVKKKHPRKNPSPQKLVPLADRELLYPVEIKVEPQDVEDADTQYEHDFSSSCLLRLPAADQRAQRSSRHKHRSSHHCRKHSKEDVRHKVKSPLKMKTKSHDKDLEKLKHKRKESKRKNIDKSKGKVNVDKKNSKKHRHSKSPLVKSDHVLLGNNKVDSNVKVEQKSLDAGSKDDTSQLGKVVCGKKEKARHSKRKQKRVEELSKSSKGKRKNVVKTTERSVRCAKKTKRNEDINTSPLKKQKLESGAARTVTHDVQNPKTLASTQEDNTSSQTCSNESNKLGSEASDVGSNEMNSVKSPEQVSEVVTHDEEKCFDAGVKSTDKIESTSHREPSKHQLELSQPQVNLDKPGDNSELNLLTENLLSLNQDSAHLNTVIHRKPTPKKRRTHSRHGKVHSRLTPLKLLTPRKSPWKTFSLRVTPHRHSTPSSSCHTPRSTPGSTSGSIPDLHTPKSTPCSVKSERKFQIVKRTPSKVSIKRRLYAAMKSPEKIIDENEDVTNLSFPDMTSPESDGIQPCNFEDSPEKIHTVTPKSSAKKRLSSIKFNLSATEQEDDGASSSSEKLNIMSDLDEDPLDQILEEKSKKVQHVHLTAKNVRSIIHQVITNEHVLDMVRNTLKEDGLGDQLKEAIFEPRLTRSMVKEAIQKGTIPLPWSFSPIKVLKDEMLKPGPQFLEMKFSDSEDNDEEYQPSPEELEHADDDEESICSQASDFGSPFPSCLPTSSPCVSKSDADNTTTTSSMGPPAVTQVPGSKHMKNHSDGAQKVGVEDTQDMTEEMMIAKRTRSKLPLTDTPLEVIESEFVAPDITPDMYDTHCDDTEWQEFLAGLMKSQDLNDTCDEAEDPEYNFLADDEVDIIDDEDFRNDKAVNIPKKEVDELMSELFEAYSGTVVGDDSTLDNMGDAHTPGSENPKSVPNNADDPETNVPSSPETPGDQHQSASDSGYPGWLPPLELNPHMASIVASDIMRIKHNTDLISSVPQLTELELIQLQDQMRKHVQLLAQTFVQCGASDDQVLKSTQNTARSLLLELRVLGEMAELKKGHTYMKPPNLSEAIQITELNLKSDNPEAEELLSKNLNSMLPPKKACEHPLTYKQMDVLVSSPVFIFPQMLPDYALVRDSRCKKRVAFTRAEDNLLAMGFDQFHQLEKRYLYIHKFLLPTKQREQIRFRHKNLRSRHNRQDKCALNYWYENGHLPEFQRYFELEEVADIKAPRYRDPELLPAWYQAYLSTKQQIEPQSTDADSAVLVSADDKSNPSSGSTSSCVKNFKRETQKGYSLKKPVAKKLTYDRLRPVASKPPAGEQLSSSIIVSSSALPVQNQDSDISQQVLDTLMSAITNDSSSAAGNRVVANTSSVLPLVTVAGDNQQAQPVVMLTTSQLEQLGIKVNVINSPNIGLSTTTNNGDQCVLATSEQSPVCQNVVISQAPADAGQGLNISSQSLISHAFSEATGIPLDSLQSETEIMTGSPASNEVLPPVVLSDVLMKEDNTNPNMSTITENNIDNKDDTEGRDKDMNPTEDAKGKQNHNDNKSTSQVNTNPDDKDGSNVTSVLEQDNSFRKSSEPCNTAEPSDTVHGQTAGEAGIQSCGGRINELVSDNANEVNKSPKTLDGYDGGDGAERQGKSPEQTSVTKDLDAKCGDSEVKESSSTGNVDGSVGVNPSSNQQSLMQVDDSPVKHTIHMMAELAQLISPPTKISPLKWPHQHRASFMTPHKKSPRKSVLKPLRPLGSVTASPVKLNLPKKSVIGRPRRYNQSQNRKNFNKQAQSIAPKGFIVQSYVSPVKLAAANISAKARKKNHSKSKAVRVLRALLPKAGTKASSDLEDDFNIIDDNENRGFCGFRDQLQREAKMDQDMDGFSETEAGNESQPDEEQLDEEGEDEADRDEDRLAQLMAASTTVRSVAKKSAIGDQKRKKIYKRAALLELLEPDLVDNDPRRDERDTAFAQGYLLKVQQALSDQPEQYEKFLKLLYEFGCSDKTPVELYFSIKDLLKDHPILLSDFAGFLMPDQAKVCGCLMEHINFKRCREFLRKLEIYFSKQPHTLQRVIKAFAQWQNSSHSDPSDLMATVKPLLKGQPYLLDEFTKFFDYEKPPESSRTEFEEVSLPDDSDEEQPEFDGYEEVQFPDGDDDDELYGTKLCRCHCHENNELKFARRRVHCRSCAVRVVRGHVYLQSSERDLYILQPSVIHHSPSDDAADAEPNSGGDEEMMENIAPPDAISKPKTSSKKLKVKLQSMKRTHALSPEKVPPNSDANSLDGFTGRNDTVCEDGRRLSDVSQSVSLHVLSCGEEAILSPDGATCQLTNTSSGQVIGPTDFSHMSQEFKKRSNNETEQMESDCIVKDNTGDVIALNSKMESDDGVDDKCSEEGNSEKPCESAAHDTCNLNQVKSESDNETEQNMQLESNAVENSSSGVNVCGMESTVPCGRQDNNDVDASSDHSSADSDTAPEESAVSWSREDDRLILETCRRDGTGDEVFQNLARTLGKTSEQVMQRFIMMINLLAEDEEGTEASEGEGEE